MRFFWNLLEVEQNNKNGIDLEVYLWYNSVNVG
jgi:hypothetical protein